MKRLAIYTLLSGLALSRLANGQTTIVSTVAGSGAFGLGVPGSFSGDGGPATSALMNQPCDVVVDAAGNLFIADTFNHRIRKVSADGIITTVAGNGTAGFSGDGGPATAGEFNQPYGIAIDTAGDLFIADYFNQRIRKVSAGGIVTTVAGNGGFGGFSGDGGPAISAYLNYPIGVAVDAAGNVFVADSQNNRIRKVSTNGIITTVAGGGGGAAGGQVGYYAGGFSGDGGPATAASMAVPNGVAVDASGNLFIADGYNERIRKVSADGVISTVAGSGNFFIAANAGIGVGYANGGFSGDGGPATSALLNTPYGVTVDAAGNLFIGDVGNDRIRKVSAGGTITTFAGNGTAGFSGDGGPATAASFYYPPRVAVDASGNVFIADTSSERIREVQTLNTLGGLQNAASYSLGAMSPGEIVILYGTGMGTATLAAAQVDSSTGLLKTTVAGTTVTVNGTPAPILYTSADQVSVVAPYEIVGSATAEILVNYQGKNVAAGAVTVAPAALGLFTAAFGSGQAAAVNQDGTVNSASNPAASGSIIVLYLTGEGQTSPAGVDGKIASAPPYPAPLLPVTITIGGQPAAYSYVGAAPAEVAGIMQINATIPTGITGSAVPVSVQVGTASTQNGVTVAVH